MSQPHQGRIALKGQPTYLPFTSPHYNRARQQDPRVGVVPELVKLLIGVHYNVIPLLLEPALSLLVTRRLITFGAHCPTRMIYGRLTAFSVLGR